MPNALPRSAWLVNVVVSSDSADGTSSAANAPWQARAVISMAKLTEAPPIAETPANPASPARNVTFRPRRSASRPPSSSRLPNARLYAVTTHCRSTVLNPSARCADGSATFITVRSSTTISCARPITPRISHRRSEVLALATARLRARLEEAIREDERFAALLDEVVARRLDPASAAAQILERFDAET